jgi:hypothetical protein
MTSQKYNDMLDAQGGVCKICKKPETYLYSIGAKKGQVKRRKGLGPARRIETRRTGLMPWTNWTPKRLGACSRGSELFWELNRGRSCSICRNVSDTVFAGETSWAKSEGKHIWLLAPLSVVVI